MRTTASLFVTLGLGLSACGPRVSVHFYEGNDFNVTAYASEQQYTLDDLQVMVEEEAAFLCGALEPRPLGEQDCYLRDRQLCYSAAFGCGD